LVRKNALASPRPWLCLTSPHLARPPHAPQSAGSCKPAPVCRRPVRSAPVRCNWTGHPPPSPHSAAATTHRRSGALNPVRRRHPVRGRPVRPPPVRRNCTGDPPPSPQSAAATLHRGSGALNPVRRRRRVRPLLSAIGAAAIDVLPPRRCGSRRSRRRCRRSTGAPIPAAISSSAPATREVRSTCCVPCAIVSFFLEQVVTFLENSLTKASSVNVRGVQMIKAYQGTQTTF
jgi:hypothetical protein